MPGRLEAPGVLRIVPWSGALVLVSLFGSAAAHAQDASQQRTPDAAPAQTAPANAPVNVEELPISVERIQGQLERPPAIRLEHLRPTFRVEIVVDRPKWVAEIDWLGAQKGLPVPAGPAWHDQFLGMVTPAQARPYGAFEGTDLLQMLVSSLAQGLATRAVSSAVTSTIQDKRLQEAKEEVDASIAAWKREREAVAAAEAAARAADGSASDAKDGNASTDANPP